MSVRLSDPPANFHPVHARKHNIQDDQVKGLLFGNIQTPLPVTLGKYMTIQVVQVNAEQFYNIGVIFYKEHFVHGIVLKYEISSKISKKSVEIAL
jgi:hypothetical protein